MVLAYIPCPWDGQQDHLEALFRHLPVMEPLRCREAAVLGLVMSGKDADLVCAHQWVEIETQILLEIHQKCKRCGDKVRYLQDQSRWLHPIYRKNEVNILSSRYYSRATTEISTR